MHRRLKGGWLRKPSAQLPDMTAWARSQLRSLLLLQLWRIEHLQSQGSFRQWEGEREREFNDCLIFVVQVVTTKSILSSPPFYLLLHSFERLTTHLPTNWTNGLPSFFPMKNTDIPKSSKLFILLSISPCVCLPSESRHQLFSVSWGKPLSNERKPSAQGWFGFTSAPRKKS